MNRAQMRLMAAAMKGHGVEEKGPMEAGETVQEEGVEKPFNPPRQRAVAVMLRKREGK